MRVKIISTLLLLLLVFMACSEDSTTEPSAEDFQKAEGELSELDQTIWKMSTASLVDVMEQMPDSLIDLPGFLLIQQNFLESSLAVDNHRIMKTAQDTTIQSFIEALDSLYGTHTWDGTKWVDSENPTNEVIIIYPYTNQTTGSQQSARIRLYSVILTDANIGLSFEISLDQSNIFSLALSVEGSNFNSTTTDPALTKISMTGTIVDSDGTEYQYSIVVENTSIVVSLGPSGGKQLNFTVQGSGIFDSVETGNDPTITSVTMGYGSVQLVMNNFTAEDGDIGDMLYNGVKIADLVVKSDGELYIVYTNGDEKLFGDVLTSFVLLFQV